MGKFKMYALRALATLAVVGAYAAENNTIPKGLAPLFAGLAFVCGLFHAQPIDVIGAIKKLTSKLGPSVIVILALSLNGCWLLPPVNGPMPPADGGAPDGSGLGYCLETKTHAAALDIMPKIIAALATGQYEATLAVLGAEFGGPVVYCGVVAAVDELKKIKLDKPDPTIETSVSNGRAYLVKHAQ